MVAIKSKLAEKLKNVPAAKPQRTEPLWKGPEVDGVTQSMLSRFLVCRERFRIAYIVGLKPNDQFEARMEFGNMWHVCEEHHADNQPWETELIAYSKGLMARYPIQQEQINHWYEVCKALFPVYIEHWSLHPDVVDRTPLMQEQVFDVPYKLPSGRTVKLRGKFDSVDLIGGGSQCTCGANRTGPSAEAHDKNCPAGKLHTVTGPAGIYLQENKTKSAIDVQKLTRQLGFDLQTMMYLTAMHWMNEHDEQGNGLSTNDWKMDAPIKGIRYNVIRRSAHKTADSMMKKVSDDFHAGRIGEWFARWKVEVSPGDIAKFRQQCLDPVLEQLCDWWEYISNYPIDPYAAPHQSQSSHWRHPFGVYNVLDEGGSSDLDSYLETGSEVGLRRVDKLFEELP